MKREYVCVDAYAARMMTEERNANCWIQHAINKLNDKIQQTARLGVDYIIVGFKDLVKGAETLSEAAEMLTTIEKFLQNTGYEVNVDLNDCLVTISW